MRAYITATGITFELVVVLAALMAAADGLLWQLPRRQMHGLEI